MHALIDRFHACYSPEASPVKVMLTLETRGGAPSCVESSPEDNAIARCLVGVVANHFLIPGSDPEERCAIRYPLHFE